MFIPLIAWAIGAAVSAGTAVTVTTGTILAASLITIGGMTLTVGGALAAAAAFGIAAAVFSDSDSYSNEYISEDEKDIEKEKLTSTLEKELRNLAELLLEERNPQSAEEIRAISEQVIEYVNNDEYFKALNILSQFKIIYAQTKSDERIAKQAEKLAQKLVRVRKETHRLREKA